MGGPCDFSVSPSPLGLDFGTLDFGTLDSGLTILGFNQVIIGKCFNCQLQTVTSDNSNGQIVS